MLESAPLPNRQSRRSGIEDGILGSRLCTGCEGGPRREGTEKRVRFPRIDTWRVSVTKGENAVAGRPHSSQRKRNRLEVLRHGTDAAVICQQGPAASFSRFSLTLSFLLGFLYALFHWCHSPLLVEAEWTGNEQKDHKESTWPVDHVAVVASALFVSYFGVYPRRRHRVVSR